MTSKHWLGCRRLAMLQAFECRAHLVLEHIGGIAHSRHGPLAQQPLNLRQTQGVNSVEGARVAVAGLVWLVIPAADQC